MQIEKRKIVIQKRMMLMIDMHIIGAGFPISVVEDELLVIDYGIVA